VYEPDSGTHSSIPRATLCHRYACLALVEGVGALLEVLPTDFVSELTRAAGKSPITQ